MKNFITYFTKNYTEPMKCKHPELRNGELFLANITNLKQLSQYPYKSLRIGIIAYNLFGETLLSHFPIFVKCSDYRTTSNTFKRKTGFFKLKYYYICVKHSLSRYSTPIEHPELRQGERFIFNISISKAQTSTLLHPYKTYRIGHHAFDIYNDLIPIRKETLFPVFVSESEYKSLHKKD